MEIRPWKKKPMEISNQNKNKVIGILAILFLLLAIFFGLWADRLQGKLAGAQSINNALEADVVKYRDKSGAEITEKNLILSDYKTLKAIHARDSSEISRLQQIVNKRTISATILRTSTTGTSVGTTSVTFVTKEDSLPKLTLPCDTVYPEYSYSDSTKWAKIKVKSTKDSTKVSYKFFNEYDITQEMKKSGIWPFRKFTPIVKVRNLNPNTETIGISSYAVKPKNHAGRTATIAGISAVFAFVAGVFLAK